MAANEGNGNCCGIVGVMRTINEKEMEEIVFS